MRGPGVVSAVVALVFASGAAAQWRCESAINIAQSTDAKVFYHLESAGRRNVAIDAETVAVTWEDNSNGTPTAWIALSRGGAFDGGAIRLSATAAYEPTVVATVDGFAVAWEEGGAVRLRFVALDGALGEPTVLAKDAVQVSLAAMRGEVVAVWSQVRGRAQVLRAARLSRDGKGWRKHAESFVEPKALRSAQSYSSVAVSAATVHVAWEDRREGHTRILYSHAGANLRFSAPKTLNKIVQRAGGAQYGRGPGAARPALAAWDKSGVVAVWLDKRDFEGGYDVYAARRSATRLNWGPNEKVQDDFGEAIAQWHAAVAADADARLAVAWDDDRDETSDIWLARPTQTGWSENFTLPEASGAGEQAHPSLAFDREGRLHLAWLHEHDGARALRYCRLRAAD